MVRKLAETGGSTTNRYAAKLLFQFRVMVNGNPGKRRICEERIVLLEARNAREALQRAKRRGKSTRFEYLNDQGNRVFFEFVGVMDLLYLGIECRDDEVWYDIVERVMPMERRSKLIPPEGELCAIRNGE